MSHPNAPSTTPDAPTEKPSLLERNYLLVCASQGLGYSSNMMLTPLLPLYLVGQGFTASFAGLVLGVFNVVSFSTRPLMGRLVDKGYLRGLMLATGALLALASYAYFVPHAALLFLTRAVHGLGWSGLNVGGGAWVALIAPPLRLAEAISYFTLAQKVGLTVAPALGLFLYDRFGFGINALLAGTMALSIVLVAKLTRPVAPVPRAAAPGPVWRSLIEAGALPGAIIMTLVQLNQAPMGAFVPLYAREVGIEHVEVFFLAQGAIGIVARARLGKWSDRAGRYRSMMVGLGLQLAGSVVMLTGGDLAAIVVAGMLYSVGNGVSEPSVYAIVINSTPKERQGAAMATYTMSFQAGSGIGAVVGGLIIEHLRFTALYTWALAPAVAALVAVWVFRRRGLVPEMARG
jgi:MFS family permease